MRSIIICVIAIVAAAFIPVTSMAQGIGQIGQVSVELGLEPAFPEPNEEVLVTLENLIGNNSAATISWLVDGDLVTGTENSRNITVLSPALGETLTVSAVLTLPSGQTQRITRTIEPRYLDIIIEPQTHVPSFYTGRALPSAGSMVNVTALIFGVDTPRESLLYTWRVNGQVLGGGPQRSGFKTSFEMPQDLRTLLSVEVSSLDGEVLGRASELLLSARPELHFYENHTLYGLQSLTLDDRFLGGASASIVAAPYYLDSRVYNNPDVLEWELDGRDVETNFRNPYEIVLSTNESAGSSRLDLRIQSTTQFLQGVRGSVQVFY